MRSSVDTPCWHAMNSCFHGASKFMGDQQRIISKQIGIYKIQRDLEEINQIQRQNYKKSIRQSGERRLTFLGLDEQGRGV